MIKSRSSAPKKFCRDQSHHGGFKFEKVSPHQLIFEPFRADLHKSIDLSFNHLNDILKTIDGAHLKTVELKTSNENFGQHRNWKRRTDSLAPNTLATGN
jgi:hypothetical protein